MLQNINPFRIGCHESVLDPVVHHLHEMPGTCGAAVEVALFGGTADFLAPRRSRCISPSGSQGFEDGIEMLDDLIRTADHLAITAF